MRGHLLDVNVLLALAWTNHQGHGAAHQWFVDHAARGWCTCAITELGFVRVSSNPAFSPHPATPAGALALLRELKKQPGHAYLDALPSPADSRARDVLGRVHSHRQTTDAYLLVVADGHDGVLVTFDQRLAHLDPTGDRLLVLVP